MNILLDTHIFLWFISGDDHLPKPMQFAVQDPRNEVYLSVVSVWEVILKHQLGKLPLPAPPESYVPAQRERHRIASLPMDEASAVRLPRLPSIHRDPFDRMLICQALQHNLVLATVDNTLLGYTVDVPGTPFRRPAEC